MENTVTSERSPVVQFFTNKVCVMKKMADFMENPSEEGINGLHSAVFRETSDFSLDECELQHRL